MAGTIRGCKQCQKVEELISGYESEEPESLLLGNLDFLTDSSPAGRAVILGAPPVTNTSRSHSVLFTSLIWLCLCAAAVLATVYYYEGQMSAYQTRAREECKNQMETLARELAPSN